MSRQYPRYALSQFSFIFSVLTSFLSILFPFAAHCATPSDLPSLQIWISAENAITDDDGNILQVNDLSGSSHDFTQDRESCRPLLVSDRINGLPALSFRKDQFLYSSKISQLNTDKITAFVLFRSSENGAGTILNSAYDSGAKKKSDKMWGVHISGKKVYSYARDSKGKAETVSLSREKMKWSLVSLVWNSSTKFKAWLDGEAGNSVSGLNASPSGHCATLMGYMAGDPDLPRCGDSGKTCGKINDKDIEIAEVIVYSRALSDSERLQIENYINDKYFTDHTPPAVSAVFAENAAR